MSADAYVECSECGHPLERHGLNGCDSCECAIRWTVREVREARRDAGLPMHFRAWDF